MNKQQLDAVHETRRQEVKDQQWTVQQFNLWDDGHNFPKWLAERDGMGSIEIPYRGSCR